jgi:hypothetical protein
MVLLGSPDQGMFSFLKAIIRADGHLLLNDTETLWTIDFLRGGFEKKSILPQGLFFFSFVAKHTQTHTHVQTTSSYVHIWQVTLTASA